MLRLPAKSLMRETEEVVLAQPIHGLIREVGRQFLPREIKK
jgi:hypothetical protein